MSASSTDQQRPPMAEIFKKAGKRAIGGGIPGAAAMAAQVVTLMPLRSTMNYQYRYGNSTTTAAIRTLYADGGVRRFYRGVLPALFQGPLSRFGDTAANSVGVKTAAASSTAAAWRIFLMPIDAMKTTLQVEGAKGLTVLRGRLAHGGPLVLYHGALATYSATLVGQ
ncbi:Mitochondrial carrier [Gracilaria domingensis]|nr:Mitochondrial carrier [Gracilaria domingensis]